MKLVIAPDSFKESLVAPAAAEAIARGWRQVDGAAEIVLRPMADGGEGTVDAILAAVGGERREQWVRGPLGEAALAHWGWLDDATAVLEMAALLAYVAAYFPGGTTTLRYAASMLARGGSHLLPL